MKRAFISALPALLCISGLASASWTFDVYALDHTTATPLDTGLSLNPGQRWVITVDPLDMWRAGNDVGGVREGNADGLGNPYGHNFGFYNYAGSSFRYGTLVGQIGAGAYFEVGTAFDEVVSQSGNLKLLYWDALTPVDNSGYVTATVTLIPAPGALLLASLGTAIVGSLRRRQTV